MGNPFRRRGLWIVGAIAIHTEFPDRMDIERLLNSVSLPSFARVRADPETETVTDVAAATQDELVGLSGLDRGVTVAVGLGSPTSTQSTTSRPRRRRVPQRRRVRPGHRPHREYAEPRGTVRFGGGGG